MKILRFILHLGELRSIQEVDETIVCTKSQSTQQFLAHWLGHQARGELDHVPESLLLVKVQTNIKPTAL